MWNGRPPMTGKHAEGGPIAQPMHTPPSRVPDNVGPTPGGPDPRMPPRAPDPRGPMQPHGLNHPQWGSGGQGNMGQFQPMQMFNNLQTALQPYLQNPGLQQAIGQSPIGPYAQQMQGLPFIGSLFGRQG